MFYKKIDRRFERDGRKVRFTNVIDDEAIAFESELKTIPRRDTYTQTVSKTEINLQQSTKWLKHGKNDFRLLQIKGADDRPAVQISFLLFRPKTLKSFGYATSPALGSAYTSTDEKYFALKLISELFKDEPEVLRIRLYGYKPVYRELMDFECRVRRLGFKLVEPDGVTRTTLLDVRPPEEELIMALDKKTRAKIRHHSSEKVEIRPITDLESIPQLNAALQASFQRTKGGTGYYDFEAAIRVARETEGAILIQGLYLKERPDTLMAYTVNYRNSDILEAVSAGSLSDPGLRSMPFNYFLVWEQVRWAQKHGCTLLDTGGVTDAGPEDPLAGITEFKHRISQNELEIGREMELVLRPLKFGFFKFIIALKSKLCGAK